MEAGGERSTLSDLGPIPTEPGFTATLISLVVLRNAEGKFASTHEHDGWYLPAGRFVLPSRPVGDSP